MFPSLLRAPRRAAAGSRVLLRPALEPLEARDCPAGPVITGLSATPLPYNYVSLSGTVADDTPGPITVAFSGSASGSTTTDDSGNFNCTLPGQPGDVSAVATDSQGAVSGAAQAHVPAPPSLTLNVAYNTQNSVTIYGQVTADAPGGLIVTFTGLISASTTTNADGTFQFTCNVQYLGDIHATVTDEWGQASDEAVVTLTSMVPEIQNFRAIWVSGTTWTFSGSVLDESAPGLTVKFDGPPSLQGQSTTVRSDGTFSLTVTLMPSETGMVMATVEDWFCQPSDAVYDMVHY